MSVAVDLRIVGGGDLLFQEYNDIINTPDEPEPDNTMADTNTTSSSEQPQQAPKSPQHERPPLKLVRQVSLGKRDHSPDVASTSSSTASMCRCSKYADADTAKACRHCFKKQKFSARQRKRQLERRFGSDFKPGTIRSRLGYLQNTFGDQMQSIEESVPNTFYKVMSLETFMRNSVEQHQQQHQHQHQQHELNHEQQSRHRPPELFRQSIPASSSSVEVMTFEPLQVPNFLRQEMDMDASSRQPPQEPEKSSAAVVAITAATTTREESSSEDSVMSVETVESAEDSKTVAAKRQKLNNLRGLSLLDDDGDDGDGDYEGEGEAGPMYTDAPATIRMVSATGIVEDVIIDRSNHHNALKEQVPVDSDTEQEPDVDVVAEKETSPEIEEATVAPKDETPVEKDVEVDDAKVHAAAAALEEEEEIPLVPPGAIGESSLSPDAAAADAQAPAEAMEEELSTSDTMMMVDQDEPIGESMATAQEPSGVPQEQIPSKEEAGDDNNSPLLDFDKMDVDPKGAVGETATAPQESTLSQMQMQIPVEREDATSPPSPEAHTNEEATISLVPPDMVKKVNTSAAQIPDAIQDAPSRDEPQKAGTEESTTNATAFALDEPKTSSTSAVEERDPVPTESDMEVEQGGVAVETFPVQQVLQTPDAVELARASRKAPRMGVMQGGVAYEKAEVQQRGIAFARASVQVTDAVEQARAAPKKEMKSSTKVEQDGVVSETSASKPNVASKPAPAEQNGVVVENATDIQDCPSPNSVMDSELADKKEATIKEPLPVNENRKIRFADEVGKELVEEHLIHREANFASRIVVMLLSPKDRKFEFLHAEYPLDASTTVQVLLEQVPSLATNDAFRAKTFHALLQTETSRQLDNNLALQDYSFKESEIVLGIPDDFTVANMTKMAVPLLLNKKLMKTVKQAIRKGRGLKTVISGEEWISEGSSGNSDE